LKFESVESWHQNIENGTARHRHIMLFEEKLRRRIGLHVVISGTKQSRKPIEHAEIIVNKIHCKFLGHSIAIACGCIVSRSFPTNAYFSRKEVCTIPVISAQVMRP
jgi:hypothetical protein